jgi:two-component system OmpR family response regulator
MKLLIIEDDKILAKTLLGLFKADGLACDWTDDGERGLFLASTNNYDLILSDYLLPGLNGADIVKRLRADKIMTPLIIMSVKGLTEDKTALIESGADDYLAKPFSFPELQARVKARLRRQTIIKPVILTAGDLTLDNEAFEVKKAGVTLTLANKEFALLQLFMENPDRLLNRQFITEKIWDGEADLFSNTIDTHIAKLRKKIKADNGYPIKTISGRGYKFIVKPN